MLRSSFLKVVRTLKQRFGLLFRLPHTLATRKIKADSSTQVRTVMEQNPIKRFDISDSQAAVNFYEENGFVIVKNFYPAEDYHQKYYQKNPSDYFAYVIGCRRMERLKEVWK